MERKEQVQYDFCGVPRDFSHLKYLVGLKHVIECPESQWIREYGRDPTDEERESLRYIGYQVIYDKEIDIFSKLELIVDSILYVEDLPQFTEDEIKALICRFPSMPPFLEVHMERGSPSVEVYLNAMMSYIPEKNYYELDYVVRSAQNGIQVPIPYNEQFRAVRYVPFQMDVPPYPEGLVYVDARTYVNKAPVEVPEMIVDAVSAQVEVDLSKPLSIVFDVIDDDPQLDRPLRLRVKWDDKGTSFTNQPVGLYNGDDRIVFNNSVGIGDKKDYVMLENGVMRYSTEKCYVTVICDGKKIRTRDQYILGDTDKFGIWRFEMVDKALISRTGGQPEFYQEVRDKMSAVLQHKVWRHKLRSYPLPVSIISWTVCVYTATIYLGRLVKRNKILLKLKEGNLAQIEDYFSVFSQKFPKCVYFGDKRLFIGEHAIKKKTYEIEFKRYPHHYEAFKVLDKNKNNTGEIWKI